MSEEDIECIAPVDTVPTEILFTIFFYLPLEELMKCRQVCLRWKLIIDKLAGREVFWSNLCRRDFGDVYHIARKKASRCLSWYFLYRSLYLWPKLPDAAEEADKFASASRLLDEVRSIEILRGGVLAVHKKGAIEYYNLESLRHSSRGSVTGDYAGYAENDTVIVLQSYHLHLFVIRKVLDNTGQDYNVTFDNVSMFLLTDTELFYVKLNDEIYICNISKDPLTSKVIKRAEDLDVVMSLGYSNGCLNVLTYQRNIYTVVNNKTMVLKEALSDELNILSVLYSYNFLEQLDWRVYYQWMYVMNHRVPKGPMRDIIVVRPYGDLFFVGTNFSVLLIFYKPFVNGQLDLFNSAPLRQVNFMEPSDIHDYSPILQIDVTETEKGHTVFVAMPKKIAVLKYTHNFMKPVNWAEEDY